MVNRRERRRARADLKRTSITGIKASNRFGVTVADAADMIMGVMRSARARRCVTNTPLESIATARWVGMLPDLPPEERYRCMTCSSVFSRDYMWKYFTNVSGRNGAIVSGMCRACCAGKTVHDVRNIALAISRKDNPGIEKVVHQPGAA
jgi:hypothetical protein